MLNLLTTDGKGVNRRDFLRLGSLAAGGLSLAEVLRQRAQAQDIRNDTAVIQVFLCGGPSQHDTFDPKPLVLTIDCGSCGAWTGSGARSIRTANSQRWMPFKRRRSTCSPGPRCGGPSTFRAKIRGYATAMDERG